MAPSKKQIASKKMDVVKKSAAPIGLRKNTILTTTVRGNIFLTKENLERMKKYQELWEQFEKDPLKNKLPVVEAVDDLATKKEWLPKFIEENEGPFKTAEIGHFYYFGYGSNMLAKRLHILNPTAERITAGKLSGHRLEFLGNSKTWRGAPATIMSTYGSDVLGAIWKIKDENLKDLDKQEGVHLGIYVPAYFHITCLKTGERYLCRSYQIVSKKKNIIDTRGLAAMQVPEEQQPSMTYLKTIIKGAIETELPKEYINKLEGRIHNNKKVPKMEKDLELADIQLQTYKLQRKQKENKIKRILRKCKKIEPNTNEAKTAGKRKREEEVKDEQNCETVAVKAVKEDKNESANQNAEITAEATNAEKIAEATNAEKIAEASNAEDDKSKNIN